MPSLAAELLAGRRYGLVVLLALLASVAAVATSGAPVSAPTAWPAAADSQRAPAAAAAAAVARATASADARGLGVAMCPARELASLAAASVELDDAPAVDVRWRVRVTRAPCARVAVPPDRSLTRRGAACAPGPRGPPTPAC
jgi:hypothetical protein